MGSQQHGLVVHRRADLRVELEPPALLVPIPPVGGELIDGDGVMARDHAQMPGQPASHAGGVEVNRLAGMGESHVEIHAAFGQRRGVSQHVFRGGALAPVYGIDLDALRAQLTIIEFIVGLIIPEYRQVLAERDPPDVLVEI